MQNKKDFRDRIILHCDCNSFFASVETVLNPAYRDVPMAVCGSVEDRHGIVLAKNELAKAYNVKTAETVFSAKKKCPELVIASPHYDEYVKYSKLVNDIYAKYTDIIEPFGIDESWLDVTASVKLFGSGAEIAELIRREVKQTLGITVSIGVSFNKVFAKLGSDYKKPDAITVIDKSNFKDIVFPLPVADMLFIGRKSQLRLDSMGIKTIGELADADIAVLRERFGKAGELMLRYARGEDDSPVCRSQESAKSIGNGFTFRHDLTSFDECCAGIDFLVEEIGTKLRKSNLKCATVQLTIKDTFLSSVQRQRPQNPPTDNSREIAKTAYAILRDEWNENKPIRMLTVTATNLSDASEKECEQFDIFSSQKEPEAKNEAKIDIALDKIRQKYGSSSIVNASIIGTDLGIYKNKVKKGEKK